MTWKCLNSAAYVSNTFSVDFEGMKVKIKDIKVSDLSGMTTFKFMPVSSVPLQYTSVDTMPLEYTGALKSNESMQRLLRTSDSGYTGATGDTEANWETGLCACDSGCLSSCCCVMIGLDYLLYKQVDELYQTRKSGKDVYEPTGMEASCPELYKLLGLMVTYGLSFLTGGCFECYWCYCLASQRNDVRKMYGISEPYCGMYSDCCVACCCRACMFNQLKQQLQRSTPGLINRAPETTNSMF